MVCSSQSSKKRGNRAVKQAEGILLHMGEKDALHGKGSKDGLWLVGGGGG
jgi:hypothetical protein